MVAGLVFTGKWAIVFPVILGCQGVIRMIPGISWFDGFLGFQFHGLPDSGWLEELLLLFQLGLGSNCVQCWAASIL